MGPAGLIRLTPDVVVVGGGPAGAAAAATARAAGLEVTLYAAGPGARARAGESLPPGTTALVAETFGDAGFLTRDHLPAHGNRSAWGTPGLETSDFMFSPFGPGAHVDRRAFDASLLAALRAAGVRVVASAAPPNPSAGLVVDASGRGARVARARGARRSRLDRLVAVMWLLEADHDDPDPTTTVEAAAGGWWYTSPLPGRRRIAAFLTDADLLPAALPSQLAHARRRDDRGPRLPDRRRARDRPTRRPRTSTWSPVTAGSPRATPPSPSTRSPRRASSPRSRWAATRGAPPRRCSAAPEATRSATTPSAIATSWAPTSAGAPPSTRSRPAGPARPSGRGGYAPGMWNQLGMRAASMRLPRTLSLPSMKSSGPGLVAGDEADEVDRADRVGHARLAVAVALDGAARGLDHHLPAVVLALLGLEDPPLDDRGGPAGLLAVEVVAHAAEDLAEDQLAVDPHALVELLVGRVAHQRRVLRPDR